MTDDGKELMWERDGDDYDPKANQLYALGLLESYLIEDKGDDYLTALSQVVPAMHVNFGLLTVAGVLIKFIARHSELPEEAVVLELRAYFLDERSNQDIYELGLYALVMLDELIKSQNIIQSNQVNNLSQAVTPVEIMTGFMVINSILLRMAVNHWESPITEQELLHLLRNNAFSL